MKKTVLMMALLAAASTAMASGSYQDYNHGHPVAEHDASQQDHSHTAPDAQDHNSAADHQDDANTPHVHPHADH
jgi:uncharacterized membrane protein YebE (DUF533 family)